MVSSQQLSVSSQQSAVSSQQSAVSGQQSVVSGQKVSSWHLGRLQSAVRPACAVSRLIHPSTARPPSAASACPCQSWRALHSVPSLPCGWRAPDPSRRRADRRAALTSRLTARLTSCTSPPAPAETRVPQARWRTAPIDDGASRKRVTGLARLMQSANSGCHAPPPLPRCGGGRGGKGCSHTVQSVWHHPDPAAIRLFPSPAGGSPQELPGMSSPWLIRCNEWRPAEAGRTGLMCSLDVWFTSGGYGSRRRVDPTSQRPPHHRRRCRRRHRCTAAGATTINAAATLPLPWALHSPNETDVILAYRSQLTPAPSEA